MLKMKTINNNTYVYRDNDIMRAKHFGRGFMGVRAALAYIHAQRFMRLVQGVKSGVRNDTAFPVRSLVPPTVTKTVKFFDLGEEEAV